MNLASEVQDDRGYGRQEGCGNRLADKGRFPWQLVLWHVGVDQDDPTIME